MNNGYSVDRFRQSKPRILSIGKNIKNLLSAHMAASINHDITDLAPPIIRPFSTLFLRIQSAIPVTVGLRSMASLGHLE